VPLNAPLSRLGEFTKAAIDPLFAVFEGYEIGETVVNEMADRLINRQRH
jgi:hypothetical protein